MSASHRVHPDPYDPALEPRDAILYDDCERCDEQTDAMGLDLAKLREAWELMNAVEHGRIGNPLRRRGYLTANEGRLGRTLYAVYVINERLTR